MSAYPADLHAVEETRSEMIRRVARGDSSALAELYDATSPFVFGLALKILRDSGAAEEVTLDVFLQVWRQARAFDDKRGKPSAWLVTMARSRAIDRLRSKARPWVSAEPLDAAAARSSDGPGPHEECERSERRRRVASAMAQLSPEQREAITTAYFSGLSHSEIAARLGKPLGTIKTRIRLGMMRLREILGPPDEGA